MARITQHETLALENVLSYRGLVTQQQLEEKIGEMEGQLHRMNARRSGPVVSTTFSVTPTPRGALMDMELLFPLDHPITCPTGYRFNPRFLLTNAVKLRQVGNPEQLPQSTAELSDFITSNGLTPITTSYNVTVQGASSPSELESVIIDIYVGINPNSL